MRTPRGFGSLALSRVASPATKRWLAHLVALDGARLTFDETGPELAVDFTAPADRLSRARSRLAATLLGFGLLAPARPLAAASAPARSERRAP
jgi:hypothetical protein